MEKYRTGVLILIITAITVCGMTFPSLGQEKVKQKGPSKEATGFTIARLLVGTGVENREPVGI